MWEIVAQSFYLALPAYLANMAPVIFDRLKILPSWAQPIDLGRRWGGDFIFGANKTWRGIAAAVVLGIVAAAGQALLYQNDFFRQISLVDYPRIFLLFGSLAGLGAILGDLVKSFFKRRLKIVAGASWPVFDQLDFIAGFFLFTASIFWPGWTFFIIVCLLTLLLHPLTNLVSYFLGIKKVWW